MSKQWEDTDRDKSSVIGKLAMLQEDQRKLIDQVTDKDKRVKELSKVGVAMGMGVMVMTGGCGVDVWCGVRWGEGADSLGRTQTTPLIPVY